MSSKLPMPSETAPQIDRGAPLVEARGLGVCRDSCWLIRGVDLTISPGEIVSLIGPNGSGKSTTAKVILGTITADEGTVTARPNLRVGYVPQRLLVDWTLPLTVRRLLTLTGRFSRAEVDAALDEVGLGHLADAEAHTLSGGEFQRALLARAVIRRPDLLVLDEPVQGVDFAGEIALYELICTIRDRYGCGVLLISHDLHIVMAQTDQVICLSGHVCCSGTPASVALHPEYRRLFGPRAADTVAIYRHHHDHAHLPDGQVVPLEGGEPATHEASGRAGDEGGDV